MVWQEGPGEDSQAGLMANSVQASYEILPVLLAAEDRLAF